MSSVRYPAFVNIDGVALSKSFQASPTDTIQTVTEGLRTANNINNATLILSKQGIVLSLSKSIQAQETFVPLLEADKTYRFNGTLLLHNTAADVNLPEKVNSLEQKYEKLQADVSKMVADMKLLKDSNEKMSLELRKRPRGWCTLRYPGRLVWTRPLHSELLKSIDELESIHHEWVKSINANTEMYAVAVNGPGRTFKVECEEQVETVAGASVSAPAKAKYAIDIHCVRVIIPVPKNQPDTVGSIQEFDAIVGWRRMIKNKFTGNDEVKQTCILSEMYTTPYDDEYFLSPVGGHVVPVADSPL